MFTTFFTYLNESDDINNMNEYKVGDVLIYDPHMENRFVNSNWRKGVIIEINGHTGTTKIKRDSGEIDYICVCPFCDLFSKPYKEPKIIISEDDPYGEEDWNDINESNDEENSFLVNDIYLKNDENIHKTCAEIKKSMFDKHINIIRPNQYRKYNRFFLKPIKIKSLNPSPYEYFGEKPTLILNHSYIIYLTDIITWKNPKIIITPEDPYGEENWNEKFNNMKYIKMLENDDWNTEKENKIDSGLCQSFDELEIGDRVEYVYDKNVGCVQRICDRDGKEPTLNGSVGIVMNKIYTHRNCHDRPIKVIAVVKFPAFVRINGRLRDDHPILSWRRWRIAYPQLLRKIKHKIIISEDDPYGEEDWSNEEFNWFKKKEIPIRDNPKSDLDPYGEEDWNDEEQEKLGRIRANIFKLYGGERDDTKDEFYVKSGDKYIYIGYSDYIHPFGYVFTGYIPFRYGHRKYLNKMYTGLLKPINDEDFRWIQAKMAFMNRYTARYAKKKIFTEIFDDIIKD